MLLIGLGNPGAEYQNNRHNIGFMVIDAIAEKFGASNWQNKFKGQISEFDFKGKKIRLLKPQTYMNLSGISASEMANFYKIPLQEVFTFHDELDLAFCKFKLKQGGGAGGHNGLKSLDAHLGNNYYRFRFGIGHPGEKSMVHSHVLSNFYDDEFKKLDEVFPKLLNEIHFLFEGQPQKFMSRLALDPNPKPKPEKPVEVKPAELIQK